MKRLTDPTFKYTPSHETDLRKKFAKIRRAQKAAAAEAAAKVSVLPAKKERRT